MSIIICFVILFGVCANLAPSTAGAEASTCLETAASNEFLFTNSAAGYTSFFVCNNRIFIPATLNGGRKALFLLDNGCGNTYVDRRLLSKIGFIPEETITHRALEKVDFEATIGTIPSLRLGTMEFKAPRVAVSNLPSQLQRHLGRRIDGIIGSETIKPFITYFSFDEKRIYFIHSNEDARGAIRSVRSIVYMPFSMCDYPAARTHNFVVKVMINGVAVDAIVDLGFSGGVLTSVNSEDLNLKTVDSIKKLDIAVAGFSGEGYKLRDVPVGFGDSLSQKTNIIYFASDNVPEFTLLGCEFLKRFNFLFDYEERTLYLIDRG